MEETKIKQGDVVYMKAFDAFVKVTSVVPRYTWKNIKRKKCLATALPFNKKTMLWKSELVYVLPLVSLTQFGLSYKYDVLHCEKVTQDSLNTYKGKCIVELLQKLEVVKPNEC